MKYSKELRVAFFQINVRRSNRVIETFTVRRKIFIQGNFTGIFFFSNTKWSEIIIRFRTFDDRQQIRFAFDVIAAKRVRSQTMAVVCSQRPSVGGGGQGLRFCATNDDAEIIRITRTDSRASSDCLRAVCQTSARELWNLAVTPSN